MVNSWEPLYSENYMKAKKTNKKFDFKIVSHHTAENYMKAKKTNKKFDFKVFTDTGPKTSLITDGTQQIAGGGDGTTGGTDEDLEAALFLASSISDSVSASNPIAAPTGAVSFSGDDCGEVTIVEEC
ncbi:hypothetical protein F2Q69_00027268 [Brassica cretica]|uniref:Uncharacterized protein n=1 Tax=Brassica cretica TaxID=69181 RepID=A0A8S9S2J2_BRACR|nr:hypothetical protein F2Q69_00027268 [Brassica cretica]